MKQLLLWLLFASLCPLASRSAAEVTQSPDASVLEGGSLTLSCCWTLKSTRLNITWLRNGTMVTSNKIIAGTSPGHTNCSSLTLTEVRKEDSGSYHCRVVVELPSYTVLEGTGTMVRVDGPGGPLAEGPGVPRDLLVPLLVPLLVLLLLPVLVTLAMLHRRRHRTALTARIIYEVPHCNSEPADVDQRSSGSSEGSSQWCQVLVYESFDYFEGVQVGGTK